MISTMCDGLVEPNCFEPLGVGERDLEFSFPFEQGASFFSNRHLCWSVLQNSEVPLGAFVRLERYCQMVW